MRRAVSPTSRGFGQLNLGCDRCLVCSSQAKPRAQCDTATMPVPLVPRGDHVFPARPRRHPCSCACRGCGPKLHALCALVRMDVEKRRLAQAVFQLVGVHVDHERAPIPFLSRSGLHHVERKPPGRRGRSRYSLSIDMASSPCVCDGHAKASAVRIRAIARAVIGTFTSPWCWWQVPARGYRRGSGRLAGCALRRMVNCSG